MEDKRCAWGENKILEKTKQNAIKLIAKALV